MKIQHLYESNNTLLEIHLRQGWRLCESVTQGMTQHQRLIVENIYSTFVPLIEASLTVDQIKSLFGQIEQGSTSSGNNRTMLGKGVDVAKQADQVLNDMGKWLQNTEPVKNFDQKFEQLKNKATEKFPEISKQMGRLAQLAKDNPGVTAAVVGILTGIAALGGGPIGGAIAGQILRGSVELLKGEKLSTAVGKGIKTAAYGFIAGKTFELIGDALSGGISMVKDTLIPGAVRGNFSAIFDQVGGPLGDRFASFEIKDLIGNADDVGPIIRLTNQAADAWDAGNYELSKTLWSQVQDGVEVMLTPEYLAQMASDQSTRELIGQGAKAVSGLADFMGAAAQGAIAAGVGSRDQKKESVYRQTRPLSEGQVYLLFRELQRLDEGPMDFLKKAGRVAAGAIKGAAGAVVDKVATAGKNLTTKVTADKLTKAWTKAGSPTDSDEIYNFLTAQGANKDAVKSAYQSMKLAVPKDPSQPSAEPSASSPEPESDQPQADAPTGTTGLQAAPDSTAKPSQGVEPSADQTTEPNTDKTAPARDSDTPSAEPAGGTQTPSAGRPIDVFKLAKEIKQMKPEVIAAVKQVLSSKQSQRGI